jgi:hypothetical protein
MTPRATRTRTSSRAHQRSAPGNFLGEKERVKFVSLFGLSGKQQRTILRCSHLLARMLNVFFIYTPLGDVWAFELLVRIILVPVIEDIRCHEFVHDI